MKAAPYRKYKPGSSNWLPRIPESWQQMRGRFVMKVRDMKAACLSDAEEHTGESFRSNPKVEGNRP